ncbi:unnamed protein product [Caenorhabditis nigoni]
MNLGMIFFGLNGLFESLAILLNPKSTLFRFEEFLQVLVLTELILDVRRIFSETRNILVPVNCILKNEFLALSGKSGPKAGPPVPSSDHRSQELGQRSHCPENGPNVLTTVPRNLVKSESGTPVISVVCPNNKSISA